MGDPDADQDPDGEAAVQGQAAASQMATTWSQRRWNWPEWVET
jgi:hypothetical protein